MTVKDLYKEQIPFLRAELEKCKKIIEREGLTSSKGYGLNRTDKVNPTVTVYNNLLSHYLTILGKVEEQEKKDNGKSNNRN